MVRMTWYVLDRNEYNARLKELGAVYREVMGRNFPAMTCVQVAGLVEARARVEHLLDRGRRRIAHISGPLDMVAGHDRIAIAHRPA